MKKTATLLASLFVAATAFAQVKDYREIKAPPLRSFSMPQPKRIQLGNGLVIFLQEDKELPLVRGRATIRGGVRDVPAEKAGIQRGDESYAGSPSSWGTSQSSPSRLSRSRSSASSWVWPRMPIGPR